MQGRGYGQTRLHRLSTIGPGYYWILSLYLLSIRQWRNSFQIKRSDLDMLVKNPKSQNLNLRSYLNCTGLPLFSVGDVFADTRGRIWPSYQICLVWPRITLEQLIYSHFCSPLLILPPKLVSDSAKNFCSSQWPCVILLKLNRINNLIL